MRTAVWITPPQPRFYRCPGCGQEVFEEVYVNQSGTILGCDRCLRARAVEEHLAGQVPGRRTRWI